MKQDELLKKEDSNNKNPFSAGMSQNGEDQSKRQAPRRGPPIYAGKKPAT